jgi:carbamoyl-phosphate synthase small subunit
VDATTFPEKDFRVTHRSLNDQTVEGIAHATLPVYGIQFHPEAAPGPHDALNLFRRFIQEEVKGLGKAVL